MVWTGIYNIQFKLSVKYYFLLSFWLLKNIILINCVFLYTSIQEQPELKLSSNGRKVHKLGRPLPAIEEMVAGTRLSPLIACSIDTGDQRSISSFVERWHQETSTFHLPVGEVSIMLDDVVSLLHLSIVGAFMTFSLCTATRQCCCWLSY